MVNQPTFDETWPHRVTIASGCEWAEAYEWLLERMDNTGGHGQAHYTTFSTRDYGFKDGKLAMEFKLRFG